MALLLAIGALTALQPGLPKASYVEQRSLARFPEAAWPTIGDARYFRALDAFVNDHVFGRDWGLWLYERVAPHWRKDWVYGEGGWQFNRFIVETDTAYRSGHEAEIEAALRRIAGIARREGKLLVVEEYRNKSFIYREKLPSYWQRYIPTGREAIPHYRAAARLQQEGLLLFVDHTATLQAVRGGTGEAFAPTGETHPSPEAMFRCNGELIGAVAAALGRHVEIPRSFSNAYHEKIEPGLGWVGNFHVRPALPPLDDVSVEIASAHDEVMARMPLKALLAYEGPVPTSLTQYKNPLGGAAPLPAAYIMSDSFFNFGARHLSPTIFPHFAAVNQHFNDIRLDGWDDAAVVILSHSDQSARGVAVKLNLFADRLVKRR
jgi:hypothetical protein